MMQMKRVFTGIIIVLLCLAAVPETIFAKVDTPVVADTTYEPFAVRLLAKDVENGGIIKSYGNVEIDYSMITVPDCYEYGDLIEVSFLDQKIVMPYCTSFSDVDAGETAAFDRRGEHLTLAINHGDFATKYGLAAKDGSTGKWTLHSGDQDYVDITFSMYEKGGYYEEYVIRHLNYTDVREDYPNLSDEEFANFRQISTTGIAAGKLYRTSSPIDPEHKRNTYADNAIKEAGVTVVMNLTDTDERARAHEGFPGSYYSGTDFIALDLGMDLTTEDAKQKMAKGFRFFAENPGVYAIHCQEGKDRAGITSAVIECLMGAKYEEVVADYMTTYYNYYGVTPDEDRYEVIKNSNIVKTLQQVFGVEDLTKANLADEAARYLKEGGMTDEEISKLKKNLAPEPKPVASISYDYGKKIELVDHIDGVNDKGDDGKDYFRYDAPSVFENGAKLTVNYKDGTSKTFTCDYPEFVCEDDGSKIVLFEDGGIIEDDRQSSDHWKLGSDNFIYVSYMDCEAKVPVTIIPNPVKSIDFEPAQEIVLPENVDGTYFEDEKYFNYNVYPFQNGAALTVHYTDGSSKKYICKEDDETYFVCEEDGSTIYSYDIHEVDFLTEQDKNHWKLGAENYLYVTYMGQRTKGVPVTIVTNPVASISFNPGQEIILIENQNGSMQEDDGGNKYFQYDDPYPWTQGSSLIVNYENGTAMTYTYQFDKQEEFKYYLCEETGDRIGLGGGYGLDYGTDQEEKHWTPDSENSMYVKYMGRTTRVPVTIEKNTVASIAFKPANPFLLYENVGGAMREVEGDEYFEYWNVNPFQKGSVLTVNHIDGKSYTYTYQYDSEEEVYMYKCEDNNVAPISVMTDSGVMYETDQETNHWTVGKDNHLYVNYRDSYAEIPVEIAEDPVQSISFDPGEEIVLTENTEGGFVKDDSGQTFYCYDTPNPYRVNSSLTIKYKDNTSRTYVYKASADLEGCYESEDGDIIQIDEKYYNSYCLNSYDEQWDHHWTVGSDNLMYVSYLDKAAEVKVRIKKAPTPEDEKLVEDVKAKVKTVKDAGNQVTEAQVKEAEDALAKINTSELKELYGAAFDADQNVVTAARKTVEDKKKEEASKEGSKEESKTPEPVPPKTLKTAKVKLTKSGYAIRRGKSAKIKYKKSTNGKVTFKKSKGNKNITVNKAGVIKVKKGAKKNKVYKIKVLISSKKTSTYKAFKAAKTIKVKAK